MRTKEITFKLRLPTNKPNSDGTMYTRETAQKMYENLKNCDSLPVGFPIYGNEYSKIIRHKACRRRWRTISCWIWFNTIH